jgi:outer membrane protein assembly factor BamB
MGLRLASRFARDPLVAAVAAGLLVAACQAPEGGPQLVGDAPPLWHVPGPATSTLGRPAFDSSNVYYVTAGHFVIALGMRTGAQRWSTPTSGSNNTYGSGSCALARGIVACGDYDVIVGLHAADGSVAWVYRSTTGYLPGIFQLAANATTVYAGSPSGTIYAVDAETGAPKWSAQPFAGDTTLISIFDPSVDDDIVVSGFTKFTAPGTGGAVAFDAATGAMRWLVYYPRAAADTSTNGRSTALWNGYVLATSGDGKIFALDRRTGAIVWTLPGVGRAPASGSLGPVRWGFDLRDLAVSGDRLFASSGSGWVVAYDLSAHSEAWRITANLGTIDIGFWGDDQAVYAIHAGGQLVAFSTTGPNILWEAGLHSNEGMISVVSTGDRVFASGQAGYCAFSK